MFEFAFWQQRQYRLYLDSPPTWEFLGSSRLEKRTALGLKIFVAAISEKEPDLCWKASELYSPSFPLTTCPHTSSEATNTCKNIRVYSPFGSFLPKRNSPTFSPTTWPHPEPKNILCNRRRSSRGSTSIEIHLLEEKSWVCSPRSIV